MSIALQYCHVTVNDVDEALAFYRDALAFEVRNDVASGGFRWVTLGTPGQAAGTEIVLSEPHAGRSQADGDAIQELLTKGVMPMISTMAKRIALPIIISAAAFSSVAAVSSAAYA
ncbi:VOC family protein, partial [Nonomuraea sp. NPDC055795]